MLVVEDHDDSRDLMELSLRSRGAEIVAVSSGRAALLAIMGTKLRGQGHHPAWATLV